MRHLRYSGVSLGVLAVYGMLFGTGLWWVVNLAIYQGLSPGMSSVFLQFSAFFTIVLSNVFLREPISVPHSCGMAFAAAGLFLLLMLSEHASTVSGILLVLLAALAWSLCNLLVKLKQPAEMMAFIIRSSRFSIPALFALTLASQGWSAFEGLVGGVAWQAVVSVLFQSYITTLLGYLVWNNLMKKYPAAQIAPLSLLVPVSGLVASCLFLGERLGAMQAMAIGLVLLGIMIFLNAQRWPVLQRRNNC